MPPAGASTWGRWGETDDLGMINVLDAPAALRGIACVQTGEYFNLDLGLDAFDPPITKGRTPPHHSIISAGPDILDDYLDGFFLQGSSQVDGLRHFAHPVYGFYNGHDRGGFEAGSPTLGINRLAEHGVVGRGVLVDVERFLASKGEVVDHRNGQQIPVSLLEEAAAWQGARIERHDIVLVRTGWVNYIRHADPAVREEFSGNVKCPGLAQEASTIEWFLDLEIPLVAADNLAVEALPVNPASPFRTEADGASPFTNVVTNGMMHPIFISLLGITLGELWDLDALAASCAGDGRWDFFVAVKPLNLVGGVGSPPNAFALK
jgi:hypothetical protein